MHWTEFLNYHGRGHAVRRGSARVNKMTIENDARNASNALCDEPVCGYLKQVGSATTCRKHGTVHGRESDAQSHVRKG